ncbi:uroporphyrinogen-III C-methyltransferase [Shewanella surugensis]|uniref:uroporphyrinogen-III C-methyltransferase n=1 Tax=Shewanella surugensis TaxID=212020 RepID=A0ABT0LCL6_9GAMM|nr:uroporphyrinogen-III C-methyltransferase [Shewanella surugensis]MCL1125080.1 uroporphyrinogen-III C-methyltransferase [Shewanella surugensis]
MMFNNSIHSSREVVSLAARFLAGKRLLGKVSLVGAGPGDPDLLTVKALRCIQSCDLIVYDRLVSDDICNLFPAKTESIYMGKAKNCRRFSQDDINQLLIEKAKLGMNICRLKGGDAFVFGRGGEEVLALKQAGVEVDLVPGITAAAGCTTYAGIPLTHRGLAQGCTFITAHAEKNLDIHWQSLAQLDHTLVFYMGITKADFIQSHLMNAGLDPSTPAALIENGCCDNQRVISGVLSQLSQLVESNQVQSPALIVIGKVVNLAQQLTWFQQETTARSIRQFA